MLKWKRKLKPLYAEKAQKNFVRVRAYSLGRNVEREKTDESGYK